MYGRNPVASPNRDPKGSLVVNDLFYTIQGEGPDAGVPAIFLRLAHCNLRCYFCDTEFERGEKVSIRDLFSRITHMKRLHPCRLLVITGGEPLLQNIVPLTDLVSTTLGMKVSVETAGTVMAPGLGLFFGRLPQDNLIVCSPKTPQLNQELKPLIGALKYILNAEEIDPNDGLPMKSTQIPGEVARLYRPEGLTKAVPVYVQAMDIGDRIRDAHNLRMAATVAMRHGYRLSVQLHKLVGLP